MELLSRCLKKFFAKSEGFRWVRVHTFVVVYFILSRLLYLAYLANLGLLCMPHPGMGPLV